MINKKWKISYEYEKNVFFEGDIQDYTDLGLMLSKSSTEEFRNKHDLKKDSMIHVQKISSENSIFVNRKEYFLNDVQPFQVFTSDAQYIYEGNEEPLPQTSIYIQENDKESMLLSKSRDGNIKSITIFDKTNGSSIDFKPISPTAPTYLAKVLPEDTDTNTLSQKFTLPEVRESSKPNRNLNIDHVRTRTRNDGQQIECRCTREIQMAIAYDSSFCSQMRGKENAIDEVAQIISNVSQKYQQFGVCTRVTINYVEGFCQRWLDPYYSFIKSNKSGCDGHGLLDNFQEYWEKNRNSIHRDTAHLFSGTGLECDDNGGCVVGCAYMEAMCSQEAYGVNYATFSGNSNMRAVLIAHEIGHNYGAEHFESNKDFIMYPAVNDAPSGFSLITQRSFRRKNYSCISSVFAGDVQQKITTQVRDFISEKLF